MFPCSSLQGDVRSAPHYNAWLTLHTRLEPQSRTRHDETLCRTSIIWLPAHIVGAPVVQGDCLAVRVSVFSHGLRFELAMCLAIVPAIVLLASALYVEGKHVARDVSLSKTLKAESEKNQLTCFSGTSLPAVLRGSVMSRWKGVYGCREVYLLSVCVTYVHHIASRYYCSS